MTRAYVQLMISMAFQKLGDNNKASDFLKKAESTRVIVDKDTESASMAYDRLLDEANGDRRDL